MALKQWCEVFRNHLGRFKKVVTYEFSIRTPLTEMKIVQRCCRGRPGSTSPGDFGKPLRHLFIAFLRKIFSKNAMRWFW